MSRGGLWRRDIVRLFLSAPKVDETSTLPVRVFSHDEACGRDAHALLHKKRYVFQHSVFYKMVGETGFEPEEEPQLKHSLLNSYTLEKPLWTQVGTQRIGSDCPKLAEISESWHSLPDSLKEAILLISRSSTDR